MSKLPSFAQSSSHIRPAVVQPVKPEAVFMNTLLKHVIQAVVTMNRSTDKYEKTINIKHKPFFCEQLLLF